jgi:hypothetical protein
MSYMHFLQNQNTKITTCCGSLTRDPGRGSLDSDRRERERERRRKRGRREKKKMKEETMGERRDGDMRVTIRERERVKKEI